MLGKLRKKNAVLPGGPGASPTATAEELPPPIIGKRFPTYRWTDFMVSYPGTLCVMFWLPVALLAFMNVPIPTRFEYNDSDYTIQYATANDLSVTTSEKETWEAIRLRSQKLEEYTENSDACVVKAIMGQSASSVAEYIERKAQTLNQMATSSVSDNLTARIYVIYRPMRIREAKHEAFLPLAERNQSIWDTPMRPSQASTRPHMHPISWSPASIMHPDVLDEIRGFEMNLVDYMAGQEVKTCWNIHTLHGNDILDFPECAPLTSFMGYLFPGEKAWKQSMDDPCGNISMWENSGTGQTMTSPHGAVVDLLKNEDWKWFVGKHAKPSALEFPALRMQITLTLPLDPSLSADVSRQILNDAVLDLDSWMADQKQHYPALNMAWGGETLKENEVREAASLDQRWMMLSMAIAAVAVVQHSHSFVVGIFFALMLWVNVYAALFLYRAFMQNNSVNIMFMLSHYAVLPFTTSCAYVFISSFLQSGQMASHGRLNVLSLRQRLAWVYRKAGVAIVVSTVVVLISSGVTVMLPIPAVSGFAALMLLEVVLNGYTFLTVFPCIILFHHLHFSNKRRNTQRRRELARKEKGPLVKRHPHFVSFVRELWQLSGGRKRPHKMKRGAPNPVGRADNEEDFRRNRRKQTEEFIVHVPALFSFVTKESRAFVVEEWHQLSAEHVEGLTLARHQPQIRIQPPLWRRLAGWCRGGWVSGWLARTPLDAVGWGRA